MKIIRKDGVIIGCKLDHIPFNRHCHLRYSFSHNGISSSILPHVYAQYWGGIVMPNTIDPHPITTTKLADKYRRDIAEAIPKSKSFQPYLTCYLNEQTDINDLAYGFNEGYWVAAKTYMAHGKSGTTGADWGVGNIENIYRHLDLLQKMKRPWLVHGEIHDPTTDIFKREALFIEEVLKKVLKDFPHLVVVLEHITTKNAVQFIFEMNGQVVATITPHHLLFNRNALFDGGRPPFKIGVRPDFFCLPILKEEHHRKALLGAIASGCPWFGAGDDTAAHSRESKYCVCGCAGCFNSMTSAEMYWQAFVEAEAVEHFEKFMCANFVNIYRLKPKRGTFIIEKRDWVVPTMCGNIVPLLAGLEMKWKARVVDQ